MFFYIFVLRNLGANKSQSVTMDAHTHTLTLLICAWRLLCDMPSAQGSGNEVGTPPGTGRWDAADFSADFVRIFV